ncbi:hypothetical protein TNCV_3658191 [Trichonephila clavipes]|nr:hypothetical protein TNCV_3658191 [Trichonephila clavipes]
MGIARGDLLGRIADLRRVKGYSSRINQEQHKGGYNHHIGLLEIVILHLSVNPKMYFKDPETSANTNSIEGSWSAIKKSLRGIRRWGDQFDSYLAEFMWRKLKRPNNPKDLFSAFLEAVKEIYPPLKELT